MKMDYSTIFIGNNDHFPPSEDFRYLIVLRGSGEFYHNSQCYRFSLHDLIDLPPHCSLVFKTDSPTPLLLGCIRITETTITAPGCRIVSAENTGLIRRVFYLGLDTQDVPAPAYDTVQAAIDQLMFSALLAGNLRARAMNTQVFDVIMDINAHFTEGDYDVREAINRTGYTVNHFRKLFRDETGITPTEFVSVRRIDKAIELFQLFRDHIPIKEIAWQVGYSDPYYFSRQFKQRTGVSPQQFISQL